MRLLDTCLSHSLAMGDIEEITREPIYFSKCGCI